MSELEHQVMHELLNSSKLNYVNAYWHSDATANRAHTHLQQITPFRAGTPQDDWLLIPRMVNDDEDTDEPTTGFDAYFSEDVFEKGLTHASPHNQELQVLNFEFTHPFIKPWLLTTTQAALKDIQRKQPDKSLRSLAITYSSVSLDRITLSNNKGWRFHEFFGFMRE